MIVLLRGGGGGVPARLPSSNVLVRHRLQSRQGTLPRLGADSRSSSTTSPGTCSGHVRQQTDGLLQRQPPQRHPQRDPLPRRAAYPRGPAGIHPQAALPPRRCREPPRPHPMTWFMGAAGLIGIACGPRLAWARRRRQPRRQAFSLRPLLPPPPRPHARPLVVAAASRRPPPQAPTRTSNSHGSTAPRREAAAPSTDSRRPDARRWSPLHPSMRSDPAPSCSSTAPGRCACSVKTGPLAVGQRLRARRLRLQPGPPQRRRQTVRVAGGSGRGPPRTPPQARSAPRRARCGSPEATAASTRSRPASADGCRGRRRRGVRSVGSEHPPRRGPRSAAGRGAPQAGRCPGNADAKAAREAASAVSAASHAVCTRSCIAPSSTPSRTTPAAAAAAAGRRKAAVAPRHRAGRRRRRARPVTARTPSGPASRSSGKRPPPTEPPDRSDGRVVASVGVEPADPGARSVEWTRTALGGPSREGPRHRPACRRAGSAHCPSSASTTSSEHAGPVHARRVGRFVRGEQRGGADGRDGVACAFERRNRRGRGRRRWWR